METFRRLAMAFFVVMSCGSFIACGDDDDESLNRNSLIGTKWYSTMARPGAEFPHPGYSLEFKKDGTFEIWERFQYSNGKLVPLEMDVPCEKGEYRCDEEVQTVTMLHLYRGTVLNYNDVWDNGATPEFGWSYIEDKTRQQRGTAKYEISDEWLELGGIKYSRQPLSAEELEKWYLPLY